MLILRLLFVLLLSGMLFYLPIHHPYLIWIKPTCKSPWEMLKVLTMPLMIQTIVESLFCLPAIYLPSRLTMMVIGITFMMVILYIALKWFHINRRPAFLLGYAIGLFSAFFTEHVYAGMDVILHPYDPCFAGIGILFILLIFIINTYSENNYWFFLS